MRNLSVTVQLGKKFWLNLVALKWRLIMKILFYDTKSYDKNSFEKELPNFPAIEIDYLKADLVPKTAPLAEGFDAVCAFVSSDVGADTLQILHDKGIRLVLLRSAGFNNVDLDKARQLGMKDSHFENPNGLDAPEHYSTARDLAILASYAMENPIFYKTVSARNVTVGERHLRNHNKLLWLYEGADGVKTGYTRAAGRILVSSATRDGRRLIAVTINAPDDWNDHMAMLNQGFSGFEQKRIVSTGEIIGFAEIAGGFSGSVQLLAADNFDYALAPDEKVSFVMPGTGFVYAPVACGADAGFVHVCVDGKSVGKVPVQYGETIEQIPQKELNFWQRLVGGD